MEKLLNIVEVAELLGVAKQTLYSWVSEHRITVVKMGNLNKFRPRDVQEFVERNLKQQKDIHL